MNADDAPKPARVSLPGGSFSTIRWSRKKLGIFIAFGFAAHVAFVFILGTKRPLQPRQVTDGPKFQLANAANELIALEDPTLFTLPHVEDFVPAIWRRMPEVTQPPIRWTEPPPFLPPAVETLGTVFNAFMASNQFTRLSLDFMPAPVLNAPELPFVSALPQKSTLQILGAISQRPLEDHLVVPTLKWDDVIAPSRVQVLVDGAGKVISAVLLPSASALENAGRTEIGDTNALNIARELRFAPAKGVTLGELTFNWHTIPTTNAP